jgi:nitroimidazol reductase NimA-like FMN-containing flavoprotein (pyridoxamine 5'-phosphate oxidase superfamily)
MRRKDFEILDRNKAYQFLDTCLDGVLVTFGENDRLSSRPMNFVRVGESIFFHGARKGEKLIGINRSATFNAYEALSLIPSYWSDVDMACPATALFQSIVIKGHYSLVVDFKEKIIALEALMLKLQPEGGYKSMASHNDLYQREIDGVNVFQLEVNELSFKLKVGQNWTASKLEKVKNELKKRNTPIDQKTLTIIDDYYNNK